MLHEFVVAIGAALSCAAAAVLYGEDVQQPAAPIAVPTNAETLVATGALLTTANPNGKAVVRAWLQLTVGAGTTGITLTMYSGNAIGGRVVGTRTPDAGDFTAGSTSQFEAEFTDPFDNTSGVQYCVSVTQTGATGDGSVVAALIDTKVLSG